MCTIGPMRLRLQLSSETGKASLDLRDLRITNVPKPMQESRLKIDWGLFPLAVVPARRVYTRFQKISTSKPLLPCAVSLHGARPHF